MTAEKHIKLVYVVFREHTLGYLVRCGDFGFSFEILFGKITIGGLNWINGNYPIGSDQFKHIREATQKDFDFFNVSSNGHIKPYKKTNVILW